MAPPQPSNRKTPGKTKPPAGGSSAASEEPKPPAKAAPQKPTTAARGAPPVQPGTSSQRKPPVPNPRAEAAAREEAQKKLTAELAETQQAAEAAKEEAATATQELQRVEEQLRQSTERETNLANLVDTLGYSSIKRARRACDLVCVARVCVLNASILTHRLRRRLCACVCARWSAAVNGIDWSVADARALLEEEATELAKLDALMASVRSQREMMAPMLEQQELLQERLLSLPVQVA